MESSLIKLSPRLVVDTGLMSWKDCQDACLEDYKASRNLNNACGYLRFFMHGENSIRCKPQQIHMTQQTLILSTAIKGEEDNVDIKYFTQSFDKRRLKGVIETECTDDFFVYRGEYEKKEYIILSKIELQSKVYTFKGMILNKTSDTEINRSLKFSKYAKVFIVWEAEPSIKTLSRFELVNYVKNKSITLESFTNRIFYHPVRNQLFRHPENYRTLKLAQMLSGKYEGYPLHIATVGAPGFGKTMEEESQDSIFKEPLGIMELGNSTVKALVPSFKEKPASPGYILKCDRMALIDEFFKAVEKGLVGNKSEIAVKNDLAALNPILEHKQRAFGSGNDNTFVSQATAKVTIHGNPIKTCNTLAEHLKFIDATTISRLVPYVLDSEHKQFINLEKLQEKKGSHKDIRNRNEKELYISSGDPLHIIDDNDWLTIYDSCQEFIVNFDMSKIKTIFKGSLAVINDKELTELWEARGVHHLVLLLDGIVKARCLFETHIPDFFALDVDYDNLERLVHSILKTWAYNFNLDNPCVYCNKKESSFPIETPIYCIDCNNKVNFNLRPSNVAAGRPEVSQGRPQ